MALNPDKAAITAASWDFYVAQTSGAESIFAAHRERCLKAFLDGEAMRTIERPLAGDLRDVAWAWPWFDTWLARFREMGVFPTSWGAIENALAPSEPEEPWDEELDGPEPEFDPAPTIRDEMLKLLLRCISHSA